MPQRHHFAIEGIERVDRFLDLEDLLGPDRGVRGRRQRPSSIEARAAELAWGIGSR